MKKISVLITALMIAVGAMNAQTVTHLQTIDNAVRALAGDLNRKLADERVQRVNVTQFVYQGSVTSFGEYWASQLTAELTNIRNRSFTIISGGTADWTISGDIVMIGDIIRINTRLVRRSDQSVVSVIQTNLERNNQIAMMLASGTGEGSSVPFDEWEIDSMDSPVAVEIGADESAPFMQRTLHGNGDEDFFLIVPNRNGRLIMETSGSVDTFMELYDANTREMLDSNDDGGNGNNARIAHNVQAGRRYIAKVRGYSESISGNYGFRTHIHTVNLGNPANYDIGTDITAQFVQRTLDSGSSHTFLLRPNRNGTLIMETTGEIDAYLEFYDAENSELLAEDDDSGSGNNAQIRHEVQAGKRYIARVRGYNADVSGSLGFRAYFRGN